MNCAVCDHDKFEPSVKAYATDPELASSVRDIGRARLDIAMAFKCLRCRTSYAGSYAGKVVVKVTQEPVQPFSVQLIQDTAEEFTNGWNMRAQGLRRFRTLTPAAEHGWDQAQARSETHKGRPPMQLRPASKEVGAYLETEEAWNYMRSRQCL